MPMSCASCSVASRSGPSPTRHRQASTPRVQEPLEGEEDVVGALDGGHAADPADREALVGDAHHPPGARPRLRRCVDALLELDAEADDRELLPRRDAERDEVVAHLRAHRDERRRRGGEAPLEHAEEAGAERGRSSRGGRGRGTCARRSAGARRRASSAAVRPTAPAFAVCVWRMCGRSRRMSPARRCAARRSWSGEISRWRSRERDDLDAPSARRRTPSSPPRARATPRRASSRSRALRGPPTGTRRGAPARPCSARADRRR